MMHLISLY